MATNQHSDSQPASVSYQRHLFVVCMWWESDEGDTSGEWRGSIEHLASHQKRYFRDMRFPETFVDKILAASEGPAVRVSSREIELPGLDELSPAARDSEV